MNRHKSLLMAIALPALLGGCTEVEPNSPALPTDKLYFKAALDGQASQPLTTRAYSADIDFATSGFTVAGYYTSGPFSTDNIYNQPYPNVFNYHDATEAAVIKVKKDANEQNLNRQYWAELPRLPLSNLFNVSYFAWASSQTGGITSETSTAAHKGYPFLRAKVGAANTTQPDIVGAVSMNHSGEYTLSAVDFDFKHLLSKMSFLFKASNGMTANITKVECVYAASAVYSEALFTFDGTADIGSWSDRKEFINESTVQPTGWNLNVPTTTDAHLLGSMVFIPQSLRDDAVSLNITYTTTQGDNAISPSTTRTVRLKALDMQPGKNYIYTLDIKAQEIEALNVKIESWIEVPGTDMGLPIVPGAMDPDVVLLLEGTDPPYVTPDGSKYWLDRSGWNRHCLIVDQTQYAGSYNFGITYNAEQKGYEFNRGDFYSAQLYNHIQIPDLGTVYGNISCEIICQDKSSGWSAPTPLAISQKVISFGQNAFQGRALLIHTNESGKNVNVWDYANTTNTDQANAGERLNLTPERNSDWAKRSFYAYSRSNGNELLSAIDKKIWVSKDASKSSTGYNMKHGMIGAVFKGVVNYVKISKKSLSYDTMLSDLKDLVPKYNIKTLAESYAPRLKGLIACWDARTGLTGGNWDGNGSEWMDQSGNGRFATGVAPSWSTLIYNASEKAIVSSSPTYSSQGVYFNVPNTPDTRYGTITIETVLQSGSDAVVNFIVTILENGGGKVPAVCARPNTGANRRELVELFSSLASGVASTHQPYKWNSKRSLVFIMDLARSRATIYCDGVLAATSSIKPDWYSFQISRIILLNSKDSNQAFTGKVHAIRIYDRALTSDEIYDNYKNDKVDFDLP